VENVANLLAGRTETKIIRNRTAVDGDNIIGQY
jgi:hypothetical protein